MTRLCAGAKAMLGGGGKVAGGGLDGRAAETWMGGLPACCDNVRYADRQFLWRRCMRRIAGLIAVVLSLACGAGWAQDVPPDPLVKTTVKKGEGYLID